MKMDKTLSLYYNNIKHSKASLELLVLDGRI